MLQNHKTMTTNKTMKNTNTKNKENKWSTNNEKHCHVSKQMIENVKAWTKVAQIWRVTRQIISNQGNTSSLWKGRSMFINCDIYCKASLFILMYAGLYICIMLNWVIMQCIPAFIFKINNCTHTHTHLN